MNEKEIKALLEDLRLSKTGIGWTIVGDQAYQSVEKIVRKHISESDTLKKIAVLESKIFVYEEVISKSNFAPFINK